MMSILETNQINGFMVVRTPALNWDAAGRGAFSRYAWCLDGIYYGGIDRMPWFEIDDQFYAGTLPEPIKHKRQRIEDFNYHDLSGIPICPDLDMVVSLLHYSNSVYPANELIAIRSDGLTPFKGVVTYDPAKVEWLGYDVVALGEQSLLHDGLFAVPGAFGDWRTRINRFGLLPTLDLVEPFTAAYRAAMEREEVEDFVEQPDLYEHTVPAIQIGRVLGTDSARDQ